MKLSDLPLHHAVLVTHGDRSSYTETLWNEVSKLSPAHRCFNQTVLDMDTARTIISWAQTPYNEERIALVSFASAGLPAQNAMLKILEEPRVGTRFILITGDKAGLIDTVLSRVYHLHLTTLSESGTVLADTFLSSVPAMRMKLPFIADMLARTDEEGRKDREAVRGFTLALVESLSKKKVERRYVTETLEIASYASDSSASGKALLEYLALLLPQVK